MGGGRDKSCARILTWAQGRLASRLLGRSTARAASSFWYSLLALVLGRPYLCPILPQDAPLPRAKTISAPVAQRGVGGLPSLRPSALARLIPSRILTPRAARSQISATLASRSASVDGTGPSSSSGPSTMQELADVRASSCNSTPSALVPDVGTKMRRSLVMTENLLHPSAHQDLPCGDPRARPLARRTTWARMTRALSPGADYRTFPGCSGSCLHLFRDKLP